MPEPKRRYYPHVETDVPPGEYQPVREPTLPRLFEPVAIGVAFLGTAALSGVAAAARAYQRVATRRR
jgi:hypothetical protein